MGITLRTQGGPPVPEGEYRARVLAITMQTNENTPEGENNQYLRWEFILTDDNGEEFTGRQLMANSSLAFGPRAKARKWAQALVGRKLGADEALDTDDLIGQEAILEVSHVEKNGNTYARVDDIIRVA